MATDKKKQEQMTRMAGQNFKGYATKAREVARMIGGTNTESVAEGQMRRSSITKDMARKEQAWLKKLAGAGGTSENLRTTQAGIRHLAGVSQQRALQESERQAKELDRKAIAKREAAIMNMTSMIGSNVEAEKSAQKQEELAIKQMDAQTEVEKYKSDAMAGDKVICTQTMHQGLLCPVILKADEAYGRTLPKEVMRGYHSWGRPVARTMKEFPILTYILAPFSRAWAHEAAFRYNGSGESNLLGRFLLKIGIPFCKFLGRRM